MKARGLVSWWASFAVVFAAAPTFAFTDGDAPAKIVDVSVFGDAVAVGNTLMQHDGATNFALLPTGSSATVTGLDPDATVERAFLFWAGSEDLLGGEDRDVDLTLPSGAFFNNLSVDSAVAGETLSPLNRCVSRTFSGTPFFSCRRDVTFLLQQLGAGGADGSYVVADVDARPGNCATDPGTCQAMFGGWAIVVVWRSPTHPVRRDLVLYDSFFAVDEQNPIAAPFSTGVSSAFTLDGFLVGDDAEVSLTFMGFEGDAQLGNPPQDSGAIGPTLFCPSCPDFIELTGGLGSARLQDAVNPVGNLFNGSNNQGGGTHPGVDIDRFDIGPTGLGIVTTGNSSLTLRVGSGDGVAGNGDPSFNPGVEFDTAGSGELVMLGFVLLSNDTFAPRLDAGASDLIVLESEAAPGDTLNYIIRVENTGSAAATSVRVRDTLPAGLTYQLGSTTNTCGVSSADVGGTSPVLTASGLVIGNLAVGAECEVRFRATIGIGVAAGTVISNTGSVEATNFPLAPLGPAITTVVGPAIATPEKTVAVVGGGPAFPGSQLIYTIRIENTGTVNALDLALTETIPSDTDTLQIVSVPPGSTNASNPGSGLVSVTNIDVPIGEDREVVYIVRVKPTTATGTTILNQADVSATWLPGGTVTTDDPTLPGAFDPTVVSVASGIDLTTSTKTVLDVNGGLLAPGDVVEYRVTIRQSGPLAATVVVEDDLAATLTGCQIVTVPFGGFAQCNPGGANGTGRVDATIPVVGGGQAELVFRATVNTTVDGAAVTNQARLTPIQEPARAVDVVAPVLNVFARPLLSSSTKSVVDLNGGDARPNDILRYTITVSNTGTVAATNLVVTDAVDTDTDVVLPLADGGVLAGGTITWTIASLGVNASVTRTFDARVKTGTPDGTLVINAAVIGADAPAATFTTPAVTTTVRASPTLVVTKTVLDTTPPPFAPADVVRYTVRVENTGDGVATSVVVRDPIDPSLAAVFFPSGGRQEGPDVVFDAVEAPALASLAPGAFTTVTFDAEVRTPLANGTVVSNQAQVTAANAGTPVLSDDPTTATPADPTVFSITSSVALALTKTFVDEDGGDLQPGDRVTFTLRVSASGDAPATNVEVRDPLDGRLTFVSSASGGTLVGGEVRFDATTSPALASVLPGTDVTLTFRADIDFPLANGTLIPNQASASAPVAAAVASDDPTTPAPLDPTVLTIVSRPELDAFTKTVVELDGDGTFAPGDRVRYTLRVENTGTEPATNIVVTDVVPANLGDLAVADGGVLAGSTITWNNSVPPLAALGPGAFVELRFEGTIARPLPDFTAVSNQATLVADSIGATASDDPATAALDDPTVFTVRSSPLLVVEKRVSDTSGAPVEPGDSLVYEIRVRNIGGRAADQITVSDPIAATLTNVVAGQGGVLSGGTLTWTPASTPALASLAIDTETTLTFTADVVSPLANGTLIDNQASVSLAEPGVPGAPFASDDPTTATPGDPTRVQVVSAANLAVTVLESTDAGGAAITTARPGNAVRYVLLVRNGGNAVATNVVVTVPLPPTLVFVAAEGGALQGGAVVFNAATSAALASVAPGAEVALAIQTTLATPLDDGTLISLQGSILADGVVSPFVTDDPSTATVGDVTTITVESDANLSLTTKGFVDVNGAPVEPGDIVQYVMLVSNAGDAVARNVVVTDPLPTAVTFVSSSTGGVVTGTIVTHTAATTPGLVAVTPGAPPVELRIEVQVNPATPDGTVVTNQATVFADGTPPVPTDDPLTAAVDDPTAFTVVTVPEITFTKDLLSPGGRVLAPGDPLTYLFVVTSTGTATVQAGTVTDTLPLPLVDVVPGPGVTYDAGTRTVSIAVPALPPLASQTFTIAARVSDTATNGTPIQNQATFQAPVVGLQLSDDPTTPVSGDPTLAIVEAFPELSASTKTATDVNGAPLLPGDVVRYVLRVENGGNGSAREVIATDAVDTARLEIVAVENGGTVSGSVIVWTRDTTPALDEIAAGAFVELAFTARVRQTVTDGTIIDNQGQIQARDLPAPVLTDDPATAAVDDATRVTVAAPILAFTKSIIDETGGPPLRPGDDVRYVLTIANTGSVPATALTITDVVPLNLVEESAVGGTISAGVASWGPLAVAANSTLNVELTGRVDPLALDGDTLVNQGELSFAEGTALASNDPSTPAPGDATARVVEALEEYTGTVSLFDVATGAPITAPVIPGQRVRAVLEMTSSGSQAGQVVTVTIPQNPVFFRFDASDDGGIESPDGTAFRWTASTRPDLAVVLPGDTRTFVAEGEVQSPIPDGVTIDVRGVVTSALAVDEEWILGPAVMTVRSRPSLDTSTKEVIDHNGGVVEPGDVLTYRITVINDGGAEARDVVLVDPAPPGTLFVPGSVSVAGAPVDVDGATMASGLALGDLGAGRSLVVAFDVRVDLVALRGLTIPNQAVLRATGMSDAVTDDPRTPLIAGDPTVVVVGGGPRLVVGKTASAATVAPGDRLDFTIVIDNVGSDVARDIHLVDAIDATASYRPGSIRVDGVPMTDADDGDAAVFPATGNARVEVRRDLLEPGQSMVVTFAVDAEGGAAILNQAQVSGEGLALVDSDAVPAAPGAQPLVVPVTGAARGVLVDQGTTALLDTNGGSVEALDPITARTVVVNRGVEPVRISAMSLELSALLVIDPAAPVDPRFVIDTTLRTLALGPGQTITVEPGESFSLVMPTAVADGATDGEELRAVARAVVTTLDNAVSREVPLGTSTLTVGLVAGTAALSGTLYVDAEERNGVFDPGTDVRASGFQVLAFPRGQEAGAPSRTAISDGQGRYRLLPLPPGQWTVIARSDAGATFAVARDVDVAPGEIKDLDLRIDPSGVVYRAGTFGPVRGARAYLFVDDEDGNPENDTLVPDGDLLPGQQGQVTTGQGFYRFDPPPGRYRLAVEPPSALFAFPSRAIPFEGAGGADPSGLVAEPAEDGRVVAHATPAEGRSTRYFLRFLLAADRPPVLNNHVPLDALADAVRITKTANRRKLSIGDLVGYTVRVDNTSSGVIGEGAGGVEIVDTLPSGFRLVPRSARFVEITRDLVGQEVRRVTVVPSSREGRTLRFGAFPLRAGASYELTYQVVVGPGTPFGDAENRARLLAARGQVPITDDVVARVRVIPDPIFDLGTLRAKVFCDDDGDLWPDPGELPMPGVRIYLDNGHYAESDLGGKLHFTGLLPGMHLAKLDERSLAPGMKVRNDPRVSFYTSAGLPSQASFALECRFDTVAAPVVTLNEDAYREDAPQRPRRMVKVEVAPSTRTVLLDGEEIPALDVDLGVAKEGDEPVFGGGEGPNLALSDDGAPRERLRFVPRAKSAVPIRGWSLTVLRDERASAPPTGGLALSGDAGGADAGASPVDAGGSTSVDGGDAGAADGGDGGAAAEGALVDGGSVARALEPASALVPVYRFAGLGAPPARIDWDGRDADGGAVVVERGARYVAVLAVAIASGDEASSAERPFGVEIGGDVPTAAPAPEASEAVILDATDGPLFDAREAPTARVKRHLAEQVKPLLERPGQLVVEVHVDPSPDVAAVALTARQAQAVVDALVALGAPADRVVAKGEGDRLPRVPNLRARDRLKNRRIEARIVDARPALAPVAARPVGTFARLDDAPWAANAAGPLVSTEVEREIGAVLTVEVGSDTGAHRLVRRVVLDEGTANLGVVEDAAGAPVTLGLDPSTNVLTFGERSRSLALLDAALVPETPGADGAVFVMQDGAGEAGFGISVPSDVAVARWTFRVVEPYAAAPASDAVAAGSAAPTSTSDAGDAPDAGAPDGGAGVAPVSVAAVAPAASEARDDDPATARTKTLFELRGEGAPPARVAWDGKLASGLFVADPQRPTAARLIVEAANGDTVVTRDVPITVGASSDVRATVAARFVLDDPTDARGRLTRAAQKRVAEIAAALGGSDAAVRVDAHTDDRGARLERLSRSQRMADAVKAALIARGVDAGRVVALGRSSDLPRAPNINARGRAQNRRVEIVLDATPTAAPRGPVSRLTANGRPLTLTDGRGDGEVPVSSTGEIAIMLATADGVRARVLLRTFGEDVVAGRPDVVDATLTRVVDEALRAARTPLMVDGGVGDGGAADASSVGEVDGGGADDDGGPDGGRTDDGGAALPDAGAPAPLGPVAVVVDGGDADGGAVVAVGDGGTRPTGGSSVVKRKASASPRLAYRGEGSAPAWWPTVDAVAAADLTVHLPPETEVLTSRKLFVHGRTRPTNRVLVNGAETELDEDGRFARVIELPEGSSEIVVEAIDGVGNRGRVSRLVHVDSKGWFALLLADTAIGSDGAQLDERSPTTSLTVGDVFLYGHGVAYVNGRFEGDVFFKDYELTLHADTRRWADDIFVRDVFEPDLLYPVYGDSSVEVQDAQARYPLYLDFRADASHVRVGNMRATLDGGDLLRYQRPRYGAELEFDRGWSQGVGLDREKSGPLLAPAADPWRTTAKVFATTGNENVRHARVELAGTGGAVYFLRHEDVVEGSERVAVIVRDAVTGAELARAPLMRNLDYTIRYAEGRVVLKDVVPAFADAAFLANHNLGQVRAGHRVYVEVEYDHESLEAFLGWGGGAQVKQVVWGHAEVGGGYVYESRADGTPAYQLGGVHAKLFLDPGTFVKAEWAYSQSVDAGNFVSYDGGLSYRGLGQSLDADPARRGDTVFPTERQGWAVKVDGQAELGELVGRRANDAVVRGYFQRQSPGFFAGAAIVEQGQWKWGADGRWTITDDDLVRLRYDGMIAEIPEIPHVADARFLHRQIATAGYERKILRSLTGVVEYGYGYTADSGAPAATDPSVARTYHTNVVALGLDWQALERLAINVKQEVLLTGDGGWLFGHDGQGQLKNWNDHLITHGQVRYALTKDLELQATESVRWNGENQTTFGVGWRVNEASRVYANERIAMQNGGLSTTTVVGGESQLGEGSRTYGEYQLQSGFAGQQTRGVVGLATRVTLPFGFALSFGYERTQVLAGNVTATSTGAVPPGAFTDGTFFAAPGATMGGDYLYGSGSRDAASVGVEYARGNVRASQRFELRFDNFDEERGGRDRLWGLSMTNFAWAVTPELSVLARYNIGLAQDLARAVREAHLEEGSLGLAYRPITHDWASALVKLSRRVEARPLSLKEGSAEEYSTHALSLEPIIELPWRVQLVEKLAFKHSGSVIEGGPRANAYTTLWINRLNWHALGTIRSFGIDPIIPGEIDLGMEYRVLWGITAMTMEHGPLVELQYAPLPYFRIGVGWNFTRFTDNELDRNDQDNSGFFVRAVGQY